MNQQTSEKGIKAQVNSVHHGKLTWIYIEKPTTREVDYLAKEFNFHPLNLDDILSRVQRPKIDAVLHVNHGPSFADHCLIRIQIYFHKL